MVNLLWVAIALPLASCLLFTFAGTRLAARGIAVIACGSVFVALACVALVWGELLGRAAPERALLSTGWTWLQAGEFVVRARLLFDPLAATLALIVTGIGGLIHVYAAGYMAGDPGYARFFAELNGFIAAMLLLTLADSVPLLAVGWIGVGIASALLIGFWYERAGTIGAGRKAFLYNMVGDIGLIVAMAAFFRTVGTTEMAAINANVGQMTVFWAVVAAVGLMLAAFAKSAQLPLAGWLPDAMAGPTPVSALIHAATMVAAGIYLLIRMSPVIARAELTGLVAVIGAVTALYGGGCAIAQPNLKRVLAYSTVSQLGLMVFAIGLDAGAAAAFHLATHAAFKGVLFLAAGSVIHALDGEEMLDAMGGLWRRLPQTGIAFLIGALALAGIPGFSGFFSKDAIVDVARERGTLAYLTALAIAALTAAYATRAFVRTFLGPSAARHVHPPGPVMTLPQGMLAFLAVVMGYVPVQEFLVPRLGGAVVALNLATAVVSTAVTVIAAAVTYLIVGDAARRARFATRMTGLQRFLVSGMGLDALVDALVVRPVAGIAALGQPGVSHTDAPGAVAWLRLPGIHRYVAGLALGALAVGVYLVVRGV